MKENGYNIQFRHLKPLFGFGEYANQIWKASEEEGRARPPLSADLIGLSLKFYNVVLIYLMVLGIDKGLEKLLQ